METYPSAVGGSPTKPKNYLTENIVATILGLFCCCGINAIPGVIGIIFSVQVDSKFNSGDYAGATSAAGTAKTLFYVTAGLAALGLLINVVSFLFMGGVLFEELRREIGY